MDAAQGHRWGSRRKGAAHGGDKAAERRRAKARNRRHTRQKATEAIAWSRAAFGPPEASVESARELERGEGNMFVGTAIGNLGQDPEMRYTQDGDAVTNFSLAVNEPGFEDPLWLRVTCWRRQAETANEWLRKGDKVAVTGRISLDTWTGKDGKERFDIKIDARQVEFLITKGKEDNGDSKPASSTRRRRNKS